jgi:hypothetical protein
MAMDLSNMLTGMTGNIFAALNNPPPPSMVRPATGEYFRPAVMPSYALPNLPLPPGLYWGNPNWGDSTMHIGTPPSFEEIRRILAERSGPNPAETFLGRPPGLDIAQLIHQALFNPEFQGFGRTMNPADMARAVEQFQNLGRPPGNLLDVARGMLGSLYGRMGGPFGFLGWPGQMREFSGIGLPLPQPVPGTAPPPPPRAVERDILSPQERRETLSREFRGF